tara:strand:- start:1469 stop:3958 length:2490 start_codon:yes stop_codon:yes gene_type:complete
MEAIRQLVLRILAKSGKSGIVTTIPKKNILDFQTMILAEKFMQNGIDPRVFKNADQAENMLKQIENADKAKASGITETQSAKIFNIEGQKLDPKKPIIGGTQTGKELSPELSKRLAETNTQRIKQKIADKAIDDDLPPLGSREGGPNIYSTEYVKNLDNEIINSGLYTRKEWANLSDDLKEARRRNFDSNYNDAMEGMTDLPPPGSRGGPEDIAAPVQTPEEYLKNVIEGENKKNIAKIKQRQTMLNEAIDDASPGFSGDRKVDADLVAENLAERMGLVYDDLPTKQKIDLYDQAYTGLSKKKFDPPEDFATGGRAGYKFGTGKKFLQTLFDFANKKSPMQAYKDYLKSVKARTLKANETGKFSDLPLEVIPVAAGGGLLTSALRKKLKAMSKEDVERKKERDDEADGGRIGLKSGSLKNFLERRKFLKTIVGNSPKAENARMLEKILKEQKEFKEFLDKNPPVKFPAPGDKEYDDYILRLNQIMAKDRLKSATGGRIGLKDGPKFDVQASGTKSGKQQIQNAPEGFTIDKETFNAIIKADISLSEKIDLLASYQYVKGRDRIEKNDQELFLSEGGFKDRNIGFGFNKDNEGIGGTLMYNMETGKPRLNIGFKKSFADGGRIGYKVGGFDKARRAFLKMLGIGAGTAAAAKSGILRFSDTAVPKVIEKVPINSSTSSVPPPYFFELANKIKNLGKPDNVTYQERVKIHRYTGKNGDEYELVEDLSTGDMQITKDKTGIGTYGDKSFDTIEDRTVLEYKKGDADFDVETQRGYRSADEYEEYKVEFDPDGTPADATDMDTIVQKEIIEEATGDAPSIKKAGGGIARMLGE